MALLLNKNLLKGVEKMEIYQVKKEGTKLVQWDRSKRHREIDRSYILVTEEQIQLIKNNEFLVSEYQGNYHISPSDAKQEIILNELNRFFEKTLNINLEVKTHCYAQFDYQEDYTGYVCVCRNNVFVVSLSKIESKYGHEREVPQWDESYSFSEKGLDLLVRKLEESAISK